MVKHTQTTRRLLPTYCLSVFNSSVGWRLTTFQNCNLSNLCQSIIYQPILYQCFRLFQCFSVYCLKCSHYIETSQSICNPKRCYANQLTGFQVIGTLLRNAAKHGNKKETSVRNGLNVRKKKTKKKLKIDIISQERTCKKQHYI